ncbi:phosphonate ABC transporter, permease protein PhnE [Rhabdaerophilum calidifontis]|uniref:phosphonate ABC transporter, permease protein PhnE n=1 Tax=Rhabdaerophilum calidifontis TaxID=2604328 RepID=UPI00123B55BB|nr:phosphonate ABC transporter, permease protein PhnE [Rhabdaerophilum calidifontis]
MGAPRFETSPAAPVKSPEHWHLPAPYDWRAALAVLLIGVALIWSAQRVEIDKMLRLTGEAVLAQVGLQDESQVGRGLGRMFGSLFPFVIEDRQEIARLPNLDRDNLPMFTRIEVIENTRYKMNTTTLQAEPVVEAKEYLVHPYGYLFKVADKMLETFEIAAWATIISVLLSIPLAIMGARNYTPHPVLYTASRSLVSFLRAMPELIIAMFLVLGFGFGSIAGYLALGLHGAGFLGKFYAEDIEAADRKPQEALTALGAGKLRVLRAAVLPQVAPAYVAYTLYILDRNVRMAAVIGLVGAGGIGQELKGRYDLFEYGHVGTILLVIFLTVFVLDQISARLRARLIG